jgi:6-phosphofructokinase 1
LALLVGGGPAPGINGVISAAIIEAIESEGVEVVGFMDGFKHLVKGMDGFKDLLRDDAPQSDAIKGDARRWRKLVIDDVKSINLRGGSILRTSRTNPTKSAQEMENVLDVLRQLRVGRLISIGGDDTAYAASQVYARAGGTVRVAHVPKTIDNDLPLPGSTPTFGFETARHIGTGIVRNLAEDARTTSRWYIIVSMGRTAGHLALGIGKAAAATVIIIPEEFRQRKVTLAEVCDIIIGSILRRKAGGTTYGVAVLAEGLLEAIGKEGLQPMIDSGELDHYGRIEEDEFHNMRLGLIDFARLIKDQVASKVKALGLNMDLVDKEVGYELRCADPIPFDAEYTRELGYAAVKFLQSDDSARFGAIVSVVGGKMKPLRFEEMLNPKTGKMQTRRVDVDGEGYKCATSYMIRLEKRHFAEPARLAKLADVAKMTPEAFRERFGYLVRQ